eukprot:6145543-Prymnesium_polylepis.2
MLHVTSALRRDAGLARAAPHERRALQVGQPRDDRGAEHGVPARRLPLAAGRRPRAGVPRLGRGRRHRAAQGADMHLRRRARDGPARAAAHAARPPGARPVLDGRLRRPGVRLQRAQQPVVRRGRQPRPGHDRGDDAAQDRVRGLLLLRRAGSAAQRAAGRRRRAAHHRPGAAPVAPVGGAAHAARARAARDRDDRRRQRSARRARGARGGPHARTAGDGRGVRALRLRGCPHREAAQGRRELVVAVDAQHRHVGVRAADGRGDGVDGRRRDAAR